MFISSIFVFGRASVKLLRTGFNPNKEESSYEKRIWTCTLSMPINKFDAFEDKFKCCIIIMRTV